MKKIIVLVLLALLLSGCGGTSGRDDPEIKYPQTISADAASIVIEVSYAGFWSWTSQDALNFINTLPGREVKGHRLGKVINTTRNGSTYTITLDLGPL